MQLQIKADTRQLENALYLLAREARVAPGVVIKEETGLLVRNIMQLTPPKNLAQGRKAIQGDLRRIVYPLDPSTITWEPLKQAVQKRDREAIAAILKNKRPPNMDLTRDATRMAQQHTKMRNKRGRVTRGVRPMLAALARDANRYIRDVQSRVGWTKAGFVAALNAAGKTAPGWIQRHAAASGTVVVHWGENPRVVATSLNNKIPGFQRVVDNAVKNRVITTGKKIQALIDGRAVNLGFMRVAAKS